MFTGLVQSLAEVVDVIAEPPGMRLVILEPRIATGAKTGDSIAINGCCLTVVEVTRDRLSFQAGEETLSRTNLGELAPGAVVNLEQSLRAGDAIGGHFVMGHIDAVGTVYSRHDDADWCTMWFRAPAAQLGQMASKGSVAVDGVSLTLVDVENDRFSVALIPHTLSVTTLGRRKVGDRVNIETDVLAKYVQRQSTPSPVSP
ncbi:MAG TPA: riboflavin synthase [Lacipirellulaceae bacterium]|nr:riboflavin synthase [Lacipirellulaceae bacterium]